MVDSSSFAIGSGWSDWGHLGCEGKEAAVSGLRSRSDDEWATRASCMLNITNLVGFSTARWSHGLGFVFGHVSWTRFIRHWHGICASLSERIMELS